MPINSYVAYKEMIYIKSIGMLQIRTLVYTPTVK